MENLSTPITQDEALTKRNKMLLKDSIQKSYNRIQYDRTLNDRQRRHLELEMHLLEMDYLEFFGKGVDSAS